MLRDVLAMRICGTTVAAAVALRPGIVKTLVPGLEALCGERFDGVRRRGKHLILTCREDLHLVVHLMLAGRLVLTRTETRRTQATGFCVSFRDGRELRLVENASAKRARVHVVRDPLDVAAVATAGPEPLDAAFTVAVLAERLTERRQVKKVLTDPTAVAGIGTAYADEILHAARLSPIRYANTLEAEEVERLHLEVGNVLRAAIERIRAHSQGDLVGDNRRQGMSVVGRTGEPCPTCGTPIAEIRFAETRTYYCPTCQSRGKTLADRRAWLTR